MWLGQTAMKVIVTLVGSSALGERLMQAIKLRCAVQDTRDIAFENEFSDIPNADIARLLPKSFRICRTVRVKMIIRRTVREEYGKYLREPRCECKLRVRCNVYSLVRRKENVNQPTNIIKLLYNFNTQNIRKKSYIHLYNIPFSHLLKC